MEKKFSFRHIINKAHLWVGLPSALILFIVCLTGTIYVFNKEIVKWIDADKFYVKPDIRPLLTSDLIDIVEKEKQGNRVAAITIPAARNEAWIFSLAEKKKKNEQQKPAGKGKPKREKLTNFLVDPYTGKIQGNAQTSSSQFFNTVLEAHRWLLLDHDIGSVITGVAAFLFLFLELSGLALWLPHKIKHWKRWNAWKPAFKIKSNAHWKRINYDLHRAVGFYTFLIITIMALTGPIFGFEWYKKGFNNVLRVKSQVKGEDGLKSEIRLDSLAKPLGIDKWLTNALTIYSYPGDLRITLPKDKSSTVSFTKSKTGFFASAGTDKLTLDQYSGATIKDERFSQKTIPQKISLLTKAIHTGEVFGTFSKMIYFVACLIATSLPVTGTFIWINKRRKKHVRI